MQEHDDEDGSRRSRDRVGSTQLADRRRPAPTAPSPGGARRQDQQQLAARIADGAAAPSDDATRLTVERGGGATITLNDVGRIVAWDGGARALYGFDEAEMLGVALDDLAVDGSHPCPPDAGAPSMVARRHKDGGTVCVQVTRSALPAARLPAPRAPGPTGDGRGSPSSEGWSMVPDALLDAVTGIAFRLDPDGTITFVAGQGLLQLGLAASDLVGVDISDLLDDESALATFQAIVAGTPFRGLWDLAGTLWDVNCVPVRSPDGTLAEIVGACHPAQIQADRNAAVARSEARFRALVQHSSDLVAVVDATMTISYASPSVRSLLGVAPDQLVGRAVGQIVHPDDMAIVDARLASLLSGHLDRDDVFDLRLRTGAGEWRTFELVDTDLLDDPVVGGIVVNGRDVTDRRRADDELRHRATHDSLTDLTTRTQFIDDLAELQATTGSALAVVAVGLDRFKTINDSLGHHAGDHVLVTVASRLREALPPGGLLARVGGDTFIATAPDVNHARHGRTFAEMLLDTVARPLHVAGRSISITARAGIALTHGGVPPASVVRNADAALHAAKERRNEPIAVFDAGFGAIAARQLELEQALRRAAVDDQLRVHFQPIVATHDGTLVGVEALVRWAHPELGLVPPLDFIPLAEDTGDIIEIGTWVLRESCRLLAERERQGGEPLRLSVNLSPRQLVDPGFLDRVRAAVSDTGFDPRQLTLEVTESVLVDEGPAATHVLGELRAMGIRLAIDDFGTGYSSLLYLRRLEVDALKIDRSFVDGLGHDLEDDIIVRAIITLAQSLGLDLVAEGVETEQQRALLDDFGCEYSQGYLFSKPLDHDTFAAQYPTSR